MENLEFEKWEKAQYQKEKAEFMSDKCSYCMDYLDDSGECENKFCDRLIPAEYR